MNPNQLAAYLRVCLVYVVGAVALIGIAWQGYHGNWSSPVMYVGFSYLSTILGFHIGITSPSDASAASAAAAPSAAAVPATPSAAGDPNPPVV